MFGKLKNEKIRLRWRWNVGWKEEKSNEKKRSTTASTKIILIWAPCTWPLIMKKLLLHKNTLRWMYCRCNRLCVVFGMLEWIKKTNVFSVATLRFNLIDWSRLLITLSFSGPLDGCTYEKYNEWLFNQLLSNTIWLVALLVRRFVIFYWCRSVDKNICGANSVALLW